MESASAETLQLVFSRQQRSWRSGVQHTLLVPHQAPRQDVGMFENVHCCNCASRGDILRILRDS